MIHAGQAEHLDAGVIGFDFLHQGGEGRFHRSDDDDGSFLIRRWLLEQLRVNAWSDPSIIRPGHHGKPGKNADVPPLNPGSCW